MSAAFDFDLWGLAVLLALLWLLLLLLVLWCLYKKYRGAPSKVVPEDDDNPLMLEEQRLAEEQAAEKRAQHERELAAEKAHLDRIAAEERERRLAQMSDEDAAKARAEQQARDEAKAKAEAEAKAKAEAEAKAKAEAEAKAKADADAKKKAALAALADEDERDNKSAPRIKLSADKIELSENVKFEGGKAIIKEESFDLLNEIKELLEHYPGLEIEVGGHTADVGSDPSKDAMEMKLSKDRALSVKDWLVSKGIEAKRMTAEGYGDTRPVASNKTKEGRAQNRRVEFVVTKQPDAPKLVSMQDDHIEVLEGIQFSKAKAGVKSASFELLDEIAKCMKENPDVKIEIGAHCADVGDDPEVNKLELELTQARAEEVRNKLIERGVKGSQLTAKGYGDTKPIEDNLTEINRMANRRIEFLRI